MALGVADEGPRGTTRLGRHAARSDHIEVDLRPLPATSPSSTVPSGTWSAIPAGSGSDPVTLRRSGL